MARDPMRSLFSAGGKRLRPTLVFLAGALGGADYERLAPAAIAVELVHASTLVHDDVIDHSPTRRGLPTVAAADGDGRAIVVGDFYFARAYGQAARSGDAEVVGILAEAVRLVCEGELRQQEERFRYRVGMYRYFRRIRLKTASLLEAACDLGAVLGGLDGASRLALRTYAMYLGLAFQVADDLLDYLSDEAEVGKPVGHDLLEGSATLPLLLARTDQSVAGQLGALLGQGKQLDETEVAQVVALVRQSQAPELTRRRAQALAGRAREALAKAPAHPAREALDALTTFVVERTS
ncbi:MAG TPA: polyprenyl synthetase family protein [Candidatus Dormibacteraeota bacterium]